MNSVIQVYELDEGRNFTFISVTDNFIRTTLCIVIAEKKSGHYIVNKLVFASKEHTDIVKGIVVVESRICSVGSVTWSYVLTFNYVRHNFEGCFCCSYDQRMMMYDSSYSKCMEPISKYVRCNTLHRFKTTTSERTKSRITSHLQ